jgi:hypothetical protein
VPSEGDATLCLIFVLRGTKKNLGISACVPSPERFRG